MPDFLLQIVGGFIAGLIGLLIQDRGLRLKLYSLECAVVDLQEKVISEIKKRAQAMRPPKDDLSELAKKAAEASKNSEEQPWWMKVGRG